MLSFEHVKSRRFDSNICENPRSLDFTYSNDNLFYLTNPIVERSYHLFNSEGFLLDFFLSWSANEGPGSQPDLLHGGWGC